MHVIKYYFPDILFYFSHDHSKWAEIFFSSWYFLSRSKICRHLWNQKVKYRVCISPLLDPILSQLESVHTLTFSLWSIWISFSHIRLRLLIGILSSGLRLKCCVHFFSFPVRLTCSAHVIIFYHRSNSTYSVKTTNYEAHRHVIYSSLLGPHTLITTLFSYTLHLWSSLNVAEQVSHPYTFNFLYTFIITFLNRS